MCPGTVGFAPMPGIIASIDDETEVVGIRAGGDHVTPSNEVESTRSFALHDARNRQSAQVAYSSPVASTVIDGSEMARIGSLFAEVKVASVVRVNVAPPSVERRLSIVPVNACSPA